MAETHDTLTVVDDQIGTPTYTYDLARLLVDMLEKEEYGKYHATNEGGYISWCDFAKEIFASGRNGCQCSSGDKFEQNFRQRQNALTTAEWTNLNLRKTASRRFRPGRMH